MRFDVISLFPEMFEAMRVGVIGRAIERGQVQLTLWNPRDFADDVHRTVDDRPYGGGPGMVMMVDPLRRAISAAKAVAPASPVVYLSPQGRRLDQDAVKEMAIRPGLVLLAGRYEGIDERLIEDYFHLFRVGHEIRGKIAAIKLHALDDLQGGLHAFSFFDGDHPFFADFFHGLGDQIADHRIVVGRDGADLGDFLFVFGGFAQTFERFHGSDDPRVNSPLDGHRVAAGGHKLLPFFVNGPGQNRSGGGSVSCHVTCFAGDLLNHLDTQVNEAVFEFDFFCHRHAVLGRQR